MDQLVRAGHEAARLERRPQRGPCRHAPLVEREPFRKESQIGKAVEDLAGGRANDDAAARAQRPPQLADHLVGIGEVMVDERQEGHVERAAADRQRLAGGIHVADAGRRRRGRQHPA